MNNVIKVHNSCHSSFNAQHFWVWQPVLSNGALYRALKELQLAKGVLCRDTVNPGLTLAFEFTLATHGRQ